MRGGSIILTAAGEPSTWLSLRAPSHDALVAWEELRARHAEVHVCVAVGMHIGPIASWTADGLVGIDGSLFIDHHDRLTLRIHAARSPTSRNFASIEVDFLLVCAIARTYPNDLVVFRSTREWSVLKCPLAAE